MEPTNVFEQNNRESKTLEQIHQEIESEIKTSREMCKNPGYANMENSGGPSNNSKSPVYANMENSGGPNKNSKSPAYANMEAIQASGSSQNSPSASQPSGSIHNSPTTIKASGSSHSSPSPNQHPHNSPLKICNNSP